MLAQDVRPFEAFSAKIAGKGSNFVHHQLFVVVVVVVVVVVDVVVLPVVDVLPPNGGTWLMPPSV
jgi:hypothetical protein